MGKSLNIILGVVVAAALCYAASALIAPGPLRTVAFVGAVIFGLGAGSVMGDGRPASFRSLLCSVLAAGLGCFAVAHLLPPGLPSLAGYVLVLMLATGAGTGMQRLLP